jgi:hypothetical protein
MELNCPHCNSNDIKNVSLAYEEGLYRVNTRTRITGFLFGGDGPEIFAGRARTKGFHQSGISRLLDPPVKWAYRKLVLWSGVLSILALFAYVIHVNSTPRPVSSLPVKLYVVFAPIVLALAAVVFWRHNRIVYRAKYLEWQRSFICGRCGAVSLHDISLNSPPSSGSQRPVFATSHRQNK